MPDTREAIQKVQALVTKYYQIQRENRISKYNEENTKAEFIEPLFEALGWDVRNTYHSDEVTREEKISKDRVDYSFRINGIPKFFLEAKALRENLDNPKFAEQAINYSWHKGCTWAVLTDFEAVKIFNAEWRTENVNQNRVKTIHFYDFVDKFDELWLLSRESFENGLLDKEAEKWGKKTNKSPVDEQLLADFTRFREVLSKDITKLNQDKNLTQEELDEACQRILDRLIFIKYCEDKGLEERKLISLVREWEDKKKGAMVKNLQEVYKYFDDLYNSKIFKKTHFSNRLDVSNEVLLEVIEGLHYTKDRSIVYDFSDIEADVLGNIYEQYLGHILNKTEKRASIKENSGHRKQQGIYYTPPHIVKYIVRNTVGELLEAKRSDSSIRILDPACGSGSFLIKTFDILNGYYMQNDADYYQTRLDTTAEDSVYSRKLKVLREHIFGIDLDKQAIEIAQLNLLLKITEKGKRLPLLQQNIRQGNSLIGTSLDADDHAFDWSTEFKEIMQEGGFDVIVGNPPYFNVKSDSPYRRCSDYSTLSNGTVNIAAMFVKRSLDLLKPEGYLGFIIPKSFTYVDSWQPLRDYLYKNSQLIKVVDVSKAFKDVLLEQVIIIIRKQHPNVNQNVEIISDIDSVESSTSEVSYRHLVENDTISFTTNSLETAIYSKMNKNCILLGHISENFRGIGAQKMLISDSVKRERILSGKEIQRYSITTYHDYYIKSRDARTFNKAEWLRKPKIMAQNIVAHIRDHIKLSATYDDKGFLNLDTVNNIVIKDSNYHPKYILALLNSKLISYYTYNFIYSKAIRTMHFDGSYSGKIPIRMASPSEQSHAVELVNRILELSKKHEEGRQKRTDSVLTLETEARAVDEKLDDVIFKLYEITREERQLIEESFK